MLSVRVPVPIAALLQKGLEQARKRQKMTPDLPLNDIGSPLSAQGLPSTGSNAVAKKRDASARDVYSDTYSSRFRTISLVPSYATSCSCFPRVLAFSSPTNPYRHFFNFVSEGKFGEPRRLRSKAFLQSPRACGWRSRCRTCGGNRPQMGQGVIYALKSETWSFNLRLGRGFNA